ncbi:hypothetical protein CW749_01870 [Vibrio sp. vnigr-6D03]|uniref:SMI1/KNR4 family protein n=1 Tax=Vibrio sp. vnigr-6D03 TaxID=2058088 RepID=UPI000C3237EC|nr:SMI1/KNR4 family protein [Vibrio sp. vnigr-6D03]PKF81412.1 hypothetical protein CW749_01870 [Vibrio sp. vnigr-6D03]
MNYKDLAEKLDHANSDTFWQGSADESQIDKLEELLSLQFPEDFKEFLKQLGGGGVTDSEISGIEDNDSTIDYGGTVYGDTLSAREDYNLPEHLAVIFFKDDEICWCIDTNSPKGEVISFDVFKQEVNSKIADSFERFFHEYVSLRV